MSTTEFASMPLDAGTMARFVAKFTKPSDSYEDCWEWHAAKNRKGYGHFYVGGRLEQAHRYAYAAFVAPIPVGLWVLHHCDNPPCCNPTHLFLGTSQDNVDDKLAKGRAGCLKGQDHPIAKLTDSDVLAIIELRREGAKQVDIADAFGIDQTVVSNILLGKRWSHLNATDSSLAGYAKGERVKGAKLTPAKVLFIRELNKHGLGPAAIARQLKVSDATIRRVLKGECWSHVS